MAKANKKKVALGVGLGLLAAAGAGAGYYFYGSKDASKNRKKAAKWANDMKADVVKNAKKLQKLDERAYKAIVDESMKAYASVKSIDKADLAAAASELKANWKNVEKEITRVAKTETKTAKKTIKKAVKTAVKTAKKVVAKKPAKAAAKKKKA